MHPPMHGMHRWVRGLYPETQKRYNGSVTIQTMARTSLSRYLSDPKVRSILKKKPGDAGFSLIELVVVIAVLAILAAVALPNFLGVQKDGQVAAAKNTLATMVKECAVSGLRGTGTAWSSTQANQGSLNGYELEQFNEEDTCYKGTASGAGLANYNITYNTATGATSKTCTASVGDYAVGCFTDTDLDTTVDNSTGTQTGSW